MDIVNLKVSLLEKLTRPTQATHSYSYLRESSPLVGLFDATILLAGIVAAVGGAPILGRLLGKKLPFVVRIILPILSICWVAQIWNVRPNNSPAIYAVMAVIGIGSFILLPLGLELGAEATRNAEASCGLLWFKYVYSFAFCDYTRLTLQLFSLS
jgi:Na+/melibiose symporter-like transporter